MKNKLLNQEIITRDGYVHKIVEVYGTEYEDLRILLSNKKTYFVKCAFENNYIKFVNEDLNNNIKGIILKKEIKIQKRYKRPINFVKKYVKSASGSSQKEAHDDPYFC